MTASSGVGKTHIGLALAHRAVMAGHKVRFIGAADLMMQLAAAKAQGRLKEYFNRAVLGPKLLVVDEIGYMPFGREEALNRLNPSSSSTARCWRPERPHFVVLHYALRTSAMRR